MVEIRTDEEYENALAELSKLMDIDPDPYSPEGLRLHALGSIIKAWESVHYHFDTPEAVDMIEFMMDQMQLAPEDMISYFGSVESLNEILERRRELTLEEIRALHEGLKIPAEILIRKPVLAQSVLA
jgi:HTH-type transcriptional regulator/antitoxin HigA